MMLIIGGAYQGKLTWACVALVCVGPVSATWRMAGPKRPAALLPPS